MNRDNRVFECRNCGDRCQGWHAAHEWWTCSCGENDLVEVDMEAEKEESDHDN